MDASKCGSDHKFVKEYFRIVNERMAKVGRKKEWMKQFGEAKTDFERVCFLLKSLEASNEGNSCNNHTTYIIFQRLNYVS